MSDQFDEMIELINNIKTHNTEVQLRDEYKIVAIHEMLNEIWGNIIDEWVEEESK